MSEQSKTPYEIARELHSELFELEALARSKNLVFDLDALEIRFGRMASDAAELLDRLAPAPDPQPG